MITRRELAKGIAWPPDRAPILIAAYLTGSPTSRDAQSATLADVARAVTNAMAG